MDGTIINGEIEALCCGKYFTERELATHLVNCHGQGGHIKDETVIETKTFDNQMVGHTVGIDPEEEKVKMAGNGKLFACPVCGKEFKQKSNMKTHTKIHEGA
jgi:hypothetical protein